MEQHVLFEVLFTRLRAEGFALGYDHHLRLYQLLERVQCKPGELREVLCPVFASTPWQQQRFREIFDESFPAFAAPAETERRRPWWWMGLTALTVSLLLAVVVWMGFEAWQRAKPKGSSLDQPTNKTSQVDERRETVSYRSQLIDLRALEGEQKPRQDWWAILSPVGIWLAWLLWSRRSKKVGIVRGAALPAPHYWPLRVERAGDSIFRHAEVADLCRALRRRVVSGFSVLDIRATVQATVKAAGYTTIRRRRLGKAPEYLVLIERRSLNDHFAHLIDELIELLQREGVFLERYFFEGDARALVREDGSTLQLEDLAGRCSGHRLLVFADSMTFVHPVTGRLEDWSERIWPQWTERAALLSDRPSVMIREELHSAGFVLAPASSSGVQTAVSFWNRGGGTDGLSVPRFQALERPLDKESEWVKACAIYPELNWNLSLQLAEGKLDEAEVSRLARNEWFRDGLIPPPVRERMRKGINAARREEVMAKLRALLSAHPPPPEGSAARAGWDAQLKLFDGTQDAQTQAAQEAIDDVTLLRFLEPGEPLAESWGERGARRSLMLRVATGVIAIGLSVGLYFQMAPRPSVFDRVELVNEDGGSVGDVLLDVGGVGHDAARPLPDGASSLLVKTVRPQWTKGWSKDGRILRVSVGKGRPTGLPFRLERWTSGMSFTEDNPNYRIDVDFAGQVSAVELEGYGTARLPLNGKKLDWVEESEDGIRLFVQTKKPGSFRWRLTPTKPEEAAGMQADCCVTEIKPQPDFELPYRLQTDKGSVAPGEEVQFRWTPAVGRGELRLEYGNQRTMLRAGTQAVSLRPTETQRYRIVEFGKVLSNEVEVAVVVGPAPAITYFRKGKAASSSGNAVRIEWKVQNWDGVVNLVAVGGGSTRVKPEGYMEVAPKDRATYELRAGAVSRQLVVEGVGGSRIDSLTASPMVMASGGSVNVSWRVVRRGQDRVYMLAESRQRPQGYVDPEPQELRDSGLQVFRVGATTRFTLYTEDENGKRSAEQSVTVEVGNESRRGQIMLRQVQCPSALSDELLKGTLQIRLDGGKPVQIPIEACAKFGGQSFNLGVGGTESNIQIDISGRYGQGLSGANVWRNPGEAFPFDLILPNGRGGSYVFKMVFQARSPASAARN